MMKVLSGDMMKERMGSDKMRRGGGLCSSCTVQKEKQALRFVLQCRVALYGQNVIAITPPDNVAIAI